MQCSLDQLDDACKGAPQAQTKNTKKILVAQAGKGIALLTLLLGG